MPRQRPPPIWVEIVMRCDLEELWQRTQAPEQHQRWDLRFTSIDYLPRPDPSAPQRFRYQTRIGFGLGVAGEGESVAERRHADGARTSSLRFWSQDRKSLIADGAGYWRYEPRGDGTVRFLTGYDYDVRGGFLGRAVDRWLFRPLLGWATAWSFDRLRLWLEDGLAPELLFLRSLVHTVARAVAAFTFLWHGLVPKLLARDPAEVAPLLAAGLSPATSDALVTAAGFAEIGWAALLLCTWRQRWPLLATAAAMLFLLGGVLATTPAAVTRAFNPLTLNLALAALSLLGWHAGRSLPTAARCRRQPEQGHRAVAQAAAAAAAAVEQARQAAPKEA
jgi:hypothetical protein